MDNIPQYFKYEVRLWKKISGEPWSDNNHVLKDSSPLSQVWDNVLPGGGKSRDCILGCVKVPQVESGMS